MREVSLSLFPQLLSLPSNGSPSTVIQRSIHDTPTAHPSSITSAVECDGDTMISVAIRYLLALAVLCGLEMYVGDLTMRSQKIEDGVFFDSIPGVMVEVCVSLVKLRKWPRRAVWKLGR